VTGKVVQAAQAAYVRAAVAEAGTLLELAGDARTRSLARQFSGISDREVQQIVRALQRQTPLGQLLAQFGRQGEQAIR
jgi:hypothetical protein